MATCYLCGTYIPPEKPHLRRRVKTGEVLGARAGREKILRTRSTFGMRIVCSHCAKALDLGPVREEVVWLFKLGLGLGLILFLLILMEFR